MGKKTKLLDQNETLERIAEIYAAKSEEWCDKYILELGGVKLLMPGFEDDLLIDDSRGYGVYLNDFGFTHHFVSAAGLALSDPKNLSRNLWQRLCEWRQVRRSQKNKIYWPLKMQH